MKKTAIALAVAMTGFAAVSAHAAPQDNSWYVGGKLGWSKYSSTNIESEFSGFNRDYGMRNKNQLGAGAFLGYQHNQYMGFEVGYDWLGRMNKLPTESRRGGFDYSGKYTAQGVQLTTKLGYPVMQDLDVYTRLGGMVWRAETSFRADRTPTGKTDDTEYGVSPLAAVGAEYAFNDNWASRLDYQWAWHVGDKDQLGMRPDNGMLALGLSYRFGAQSRPQPVVAPEPTPAPAQVETKRFTLTSDVLFNFGKSTLKTEGQSALDQLFSQLSEVDPKEGSVIVLGHTDRIGSEQANMRLSEERARTVVDYLVSKGIPSNVISARGLGKSSPVTGSNCDNISNRNALISCLAPDRRVEIEIQGTKQVSQ